MLFQQNSDADAVIHLHIYKDMMNLQIFDSVQLEKKITHHKVCTLSSFCLVNSSCLSPDLSELQLQDSCDAQRQGGVHFSEHHSPAFQPSWQ